MKFDHIYDTLNRVNHSTHSSAGAHHSDGATAIGGVNKVLQMIVEDASR